MARHLCLVGLILAVASSITRADEVRPLKRGPHTLTVTFEDDQLDAELYQDVRVETRGRGLSLHVLTDIKPGKPQPESGLGGGEGTAGWKGREKHQQAWLPRGRKIHGSVGDNGNIQFGITFVRDGRLLSLHCTGRSTGPEGTGKAFLLTKGQPVVEGTWQLRNPRFWALPAAPGVNGVTFPGR